MSFGVLLLFVVFTSGNVFNMDEIFENVAEIAMMNQTQIFHVGEIVAKVAGANHNAEQILSLDSMWFDSVGCSEKVLKRRVDDAASGFSIGKVEITDEQFVRFDDKRFDECVSS